MSGRRRGRPTLPRTGGTRSTSGINWVTSWRFPPVTVQASGIPVASTSRMLLWMSRCRRGRVRVQVRVGVEESEEVSGEVALQAALDLAGALAFSGAAGGVGAGGGVV